MSSDQSDRSQRSGQPGPQVTCPACGNTSLYSSQNPSRPFCSERCKVLDLGAWASDTYRVAGSPEDAAPDDEFGDPR